MKQTFFFRGVAVILVFIHRFTRARNKRRSYSHMGAVETPPRPCAVCKKAVRAHAFDQDVWARLKRCAHRVRLGAEGEYFDL